MRMTAILTTTVLLGVAPIASAHDVCQQLSAADVRSSTPAPVQIPGTALYAAPGVQATLNEPGQRGALFVKVLEFVGMRYDPQQNVGVPQFRELLVPVAPGPAAPAAAPRMPSH